MDRELVIKVLDDLQAKCDLIFNSGDEEIKKFTDQVLVSKKNKEEIKPEVVLRFFPDNKYEDNGENTWMHAVVNSLSNLNVPWGNLDFTITRILTKAYGKDAVRGGMAPLGRNWVLKYLLNRLEF